MLTPFTADRQIDWPGLDALVDWYIAGGSQGLFATCLSSEIFHLTAGERLAVAQRVQTRAAGRVPVIAAGAFTANVSTASAVGDPVELAEVMQRMADTGVEAVIILTNQLAAADDPDDVLLAAAERLLSRLDERMRLGLYECPVPYKRVLSPRVTAWAAQTKRFDFIKDTCCDLAQIKAKLAVMAGSPLRLYNAHTATLLPSLLAGGHGFSGTSANLIPHLYAWLCRHHADEPAVGGELQAFLTAGYPVVSTHYPHSAKTYLGRHGLPVTPVSRVRENEVDANDLQALDAFHAGVVAWEQRLGLPSPFDAVR